MSEVMACGDGGNDLEMIEQAGYGICYGKWRRRNKTKGKICNIVK